jgi:hypothetical protein
MLSQGQVTFFGDDFFQETTARLWRTYGQNPGWRGTLFLAHKPKAPSEFSPGYRSHFELRFVDSEVYDVNVCARREAPSSSVHAGHCEPLDAGEVTTALLLADDTLSLLLTNQGNRRFPGVMLTHAQ